MRHTCSTHTSYMCTHAAYVHHTCSIHPPYTHHTSTPHHTYTIHAPYIRPQQGVDDDHFSVFLNQSMFELIISFPRKPPDYNSAAKRWVRDYFTSFEAVRPCCIEMLHWLLHQSKCLSSYCNKNIGNTLRVMGWVGCQVALAARSSRAWKLRFPHVVLLHFTLVLHVCCMCAAWMFLLHGCYISVACISSCMFHECTMAVAWMLHTLRSILQCTLYDSRLCTAPTLTIPTTAGPSTSTARHGPIGSSFSSSA